MSLKRQFPMYVSLKIMIEFLNKNEKKCKKVLPTSTLLPRIRAHALLTRIIEFLNFELLAAHAPLSESPCALKWDNIKHSFLYLYLSMNITNSLFVSIVIC